VVYISVKEASKKWGITERRIRILCSEGRVDGVVRSGWAWNIPITAQKPGDGRKIRHIKNFDLRTGPINFDRLNEIKTGIDKYNGKQEDLQRYFDDSLNRFLSALFVEEGIDEKDVLAILNNEMNEEVSVEQICLVKNTKSIIVGFFKETGFGNIAGNGSKPIPFFSEKRFKNIQNRLFNGIDDYKQSEFRDVEIPFAGAWAQDNRTYKVKVQMETLMVQSENEWANINGVVKSSFMFGELLRIQPFEEHSLIFASIILAGNLLNAGYPLTIIDSDNYNELKADLSLTLKRGNYNKILRLFEKSLEVEYSRIKELSDTNVD
jgi:hypothetical protein